MNPLKILLFISTILVSLLGISFLSKEFIPENISSSENIEQKQGFDFGFFFLKFPTFAHISAVEPSEENQKAVAVLEKSTSVEAMKMVKNNDSIAKNDFNSNAEGKIYYPGNPSEFVKKLHQTFLLKKCRIIHYGASKNEGDRITAFIRNKLQELYGGSGPGYFPIKPPYPQKSIDIQQIGNWQRYALFNSEHRKTGQLLPNNQYGIYANVCRFTPAKFQDTTSVKKASFTIKPSYEYYQRLRDFTSMGIHYGNCTLPVAISVYENGTLLQQDTLQNDGSYHNFKVNFATTPKEIKVEFSGKISPDFYGITLDASRGIAMDNVPTRGDSGLHFTRLQSTFADMSRELNPNVFIFEFGGNLIPSLQSEKQIQKNVKRIIDNMLWVKKRNPDALFFLVGPSDMLRQNTKKSYYGINILTNEMKKQALENGFAFWSMYEAMGGQNSMRVWYDKGYAAGDRIHFSDKGTVKIASLFSQLLIENLQSIQNK